MSRTRSSSLHHVLAALSSSSDQTVQSLRVGLAEEREEDTSVEEVEAWVE